LLAPAHVRFLNEEGEIARPDQWNDPARAKLWLYNLHYFDDLMAPADGKRSAWQRALVERWIAENPPVAGNGWESYPLSLRVANWIKWALGGAPLDPAWEHSLAMQVRCLDVSIEWHLLGNHILANAKALTLAGLFFDGEEAERWLARGLSIYAKQLPEQILADGGHFELSPMYHAIMLEDLLDVHNAFRAYGREEMWEGPALVPLIGQMRAWLAALVHPDGGFAFFNDAALNIAASRDEIDAYAIRLGLPASGDSDTPLKWLHASGYVRMTAGAATLIADVAEVGPSYLPGHAHADTLSFELSLDAERIIVNGGTSVYGTGPDRQAQRATAAHSTVEIDGLDSSEVWGGFRVARRANVRVDGALCDAETRRLQAEHNGYARLPGRPLHRRLWEFGQGGLAVTDTITGRYTNAVARFHCGAGVAGHEDGLSSTGVLRTPTGRSVRWETDGALASLKPSVWHPEFGRTVPTHCLTVPIEGGTVRTTFAWT
jgi:uncharacterized heparinase superfamily protein